MSKKIVVAGVLFLVFLGAIQSVCFAALVADHGCLNLNRVPARYFKDAGRKIKVCYGHTSHGSQIVQGMRALAEYNPDLFSFGDERKNQLVSGAMSFWDKTPPGDLGNPNRTAWAGRTLELLNGQGAGRNLVMWSWCGQVSRSSAEDINLYLTQMDRLEKQFPKKVFVYMTGHLDGTGTEGNLHKRNEQIRRFCRRNNKVLFDFADIESFAPGQNTNYMALGARDNCVYRPNGQNRNWAADWLKLNPRNIFVLPQKAAHTHPLNASMKAYAFWWMCARLVGWNG